MARLVVLLVVLVHRSAVDKRAQPVRDALVRLARGPLVDERGPHVVVAHPGHQVLGRRAGLPGEQVPGVAQVVEVQPRRRVVNAEGSEPMGDTPKHSVSVAGIVVREDGRILAVQRRDNAHWEPPGGVLELDETFEAGVRREVAEETGVTVEVDRLTGAYKNFHRGVVALVFRCHPIAGQATTTDESQRVRWLTADEIRDHMAPAYAVRILDALSDNTASRAHDGVHLIAE